MSSIQRWAASQRIRGQDLNNETYTDDLKRLDIMKTRTTQDGHKVTQFRFPTIEGLEWKLRSLAWYREA